MPDVDVAMIGHAVISLKQALPGPWRGSLAALPEMAL